MTLKDLLRKNSWLNIQKELYRQYPEEEVNDEGYETVFGKLQMMRAQQSDTVIVLTLVADETLYDTPYVDVSGRKLKSPATDDVAAESYAIEFKPWDEWLGMTIDEQTAREFSETQILAHCLYEMTFVGFNQEEIQKRFEEIFILTEEIKAITKEEREGKLIPWERIKKELGI